MFYASYNEDCSILPKSLYDSNAQMNSLTISFLQHFLQVLQWFTCSIFFSLCLLPIITSVQCVNVQFGQPAAEVCGWHWKMISVLIGCIQRKRQPTLPALCFFFFFSRQCVHLVIGVNRASFVWSPVNTQKHDTFRSNYTMSSVYSPGIACTIGAIRLVPVLQGISAGSRCHCRTNGVIRTAIRPILFKLKKKMIALILDSLLLDNLQLDVGFVYSHHIILAVASMSINRLCTV